MLNIRLVKFAIPRHIVFPRPYLRNFNIKSASLFLSMFFIIFLFNSQSIFFDGLWHDDGYYYYLATKGIIFQESRFKGGWLVPLRDILTMNGMLVFSVEFVRGIFVLLICAISGFLYVFYRNILGLKSNVAFFSALIPSIMPGVVIPVGINASYPVATLFIFVLTCITIVYTAKNYDWKNSKVRTAAFCVLTFILYLSYLNASSASIFLLPSIFLLIVGCYYSKFKALVFHLVLFGTLGFYQLYRQSITTHIQPSSIPFDTVIERITAFLDKASVIPYESQYSAYITIALVLIGLLGIIRGSKVIFAKKEGFLSPNKFVGIFALLWFVGWALENAIVYVALTPTFRLQDYVYVFNYGIIPLQVFGLFYLVSNIFRPFIKTEFVSFLVVGGAITLVIANGYSKLWDLNLGWNKKQQSTSLYLRKELKKIEWVKDTQLAIISGGTWYPGLYKANSGYLRYLTSENQVKGVIGENIFPNNPFRKSVSFQANMINLDASKPIMALKRTRNGLNKFSHMLSTSINDKASYPRFTWKLYTLNDGLAPPTKLMEGNGLESYRVYLSNSLPDLQAKNILFTPQPQSGEFIFSESEVKEKGLLEADKPKRTLARGIELLRTYNSNIEGKPYHYALIHLTEDLPKGFKLAYSLGKANGTKTITSSLYLQKGDYLLLRIKPTKNSDINQISFFQVNRWPHLKL